MKYYRREFLKKGTSKTEDKIFIEYVKSNNIEKINKDKILKFIEDDEYKKELRKLKVDTIYYFDMETRESEEVKKIYEKL